MKLNDDIHKPQSELLRALGALVVNFSALEESLHDAVWVLADVGDDDRNMVTINVLTAGLQFRTLVEKFGALCTEFKSRLCVPLTEAQEFCRLVLTLNDERNRYVHSAWSAAADVGHRRFRRSAKTKTGFRLDIRSVSPDDIFDLAERLQQAEQKLWEIVP